MKHSEIRIHNQLLDASPVIHQLKPSIPVATCKNFVQSRLPGPHGPVVSGFSSFLCCTAAIPAATRAWIGPCLRLLPLPPRAVPPPAKLPFHGLLAIPLRWVGARVSDFQPITR